MGIRDPEPSGYNSAVFFGDLREEPVADDTLPPLDDCGFVRVPTTDGTPLWMTCDACSKSDHFWFADGQIRCRCGATYSHAIRPDGHELSIEALTFVPFKEGPMDLADTEWDPVRLAIVILIGMGIVGLIGFAVAWYLTQ